MSLESYLQDRDDRREHAQAEAPKARVDWMLAGASPADRLIAFDHWIREQLEKRLTWPPDPVSKARRIFQAKVELEAMLTHLYARGWLLDGQRLAKHAIAVLDPIDKAQREGKVHDFWPYFKASVTRYVGANAEEIQAESKRTGNLMAGVLGSLGVTRGDSIVELVAMRRGEVLQSKSLRDQVSAARAKKQPADSTLPLFGG